MLRTESSYDDDAPPSTSGRFKFSGMTSLRIEETFDSAMWREERDIVILIFVEERERGE